MKLEGYLHEGKFYTPEQLKDRTLPEWDKSIELYSLSCGGFEPSFKSSSATECQHCGREKWEHKI